MSSASALEQIEQDFNRLRGRLFGAIDSWGLPEKQEEAIKKIVRRETYDAHTNLVAVLRRDNHG